MQLELFDVDDFQRCNDRYLAMIRSNGELKIFGSFLAFDACFSSWF